jgi:hypothetical protein
MDGYYNTYLLNLPKIKRREFIKDVCQLYVDFVLKEAASGKKNCVISPQISDFKSKQTDDPWTDNLTYQEISNYLRTQFVDAKITLDLLQHKIYVDWSEAVKETPTW